MQRNIAFDLDEVLVPMVTNLSKYSKKRIHFKSSYKFSKMFNISEIESKKVVSMYYNSIYHDTAIPTRGTHIVLNSLKKKDFNVYIITGRQCYSKKQTLKWLRRNIHFPFEDVIFTNSFSLIGNEVSKNQICRDLNIDILIDDNLETLRTLTHTKGILFGDYPWQTDWTDDLEIPRVTSMNELNKLLNDELYLYKNNKILK